MILNSPESGEINQKVSEINRKSIFQFWAIIVWAIGAVFYSGVSYQRFNSMDKHLEGIDSKLDAISDIKTLRVRQDDDMRRLDTLEKYVMTQIEKDRNR